MNFHSVKVWRSLRKFKKLVKEDRYVLEELEIQNEELLKLLGLLKIKNTFKQRQHLGLLLQNRLKKQKKEVKNFLKHIQKSKTSIKFLTENEFTKESTIYLLEQKGLTINDVHDKESQFRPDDIQNITQVIEKALPSLLDVITKITNLLKKELIVDDIKNLIESEKVFLKSIEDATNQLVFITGQLTKKTKMTRRKFLTKTASAAGLVAGAYGYMAGGTSAIAALLHGAVLTLPKKNTKGLAILIGDIKPMNKIVGFKEAYIGRVQLAFGFQAKVIYKNATLSDYKSCLLDSTIQNIVVFGHGSTSSVNFVDKRLKDYLTYYNKLSKEMYAVSVKFAEQRLHKSGFLMKHSCGGGYNKINESFTGKWGYPTFEQKNIVRWKRVAGIPDLFLNPWGKQDKWVNHFGDLRAKIYEIMGI